MVAHGLSCLVLGADVFLETAVPAFSFSSSSYLMFALFWPWCRYSNLLYSQQSLCLWPFFHLQHSLFFKIMSFYLVRNLYFNKCNYCWFGVCRCALYFSCWPFLLHCDVLITSVLERCLSYCPCRRDLQHGFTKKHVTPWYQFWLNLLQFTRFPTGCPGELCTQTCLPLVLHGGAKVTPSFIRKPSAAYYWQLWEKRHLNGQAVVDTCT